MSGFRISVVRKFLILDPYMRTYPEIIAITYGNSYEKHRNLAHSTMTCYYGLCFILHAKFNENLGSLNETTKIFNNETQIPIWVRVRHSTQSFRVVTLNFVLSYYEQGI